VQLGQDLQIMTDKSEDKYKEEIIKELDNICEECKKEDESVSQNLILTSYKLCSSCKVSKTIFPI
jgi:cob(I)alamin adenosyltransferase